MTEQKKRSVLVALIIVSCLPALLLLSPPANQTVSSLSLYGSAVFGYLGVVMLLWMFVIGARSFFGMLFIDLAPVLRLHKWLGKYGALAILLHPLLIIVSYGESILYTFVPHANTVLERGITLGRIAFLLILLIWFTSVLFRKQLGRRPWKYIHYLAYVSLPFALLHVPQTGTQFMTHTIVRAYYFLLVVAFCTFLVIRLRSLLNVGEVTYIITRHQLIADDTYLLELKPAADEHIAPKRGQYIYIRSGVISEAHPFSVVHYDEKSGVLTVVYRVFGRFTDYLKTRHNSDVLTITGPYGEFTHELGTSARSRPIVYIAGGIGITPFIDHILSNPPGGQWLFYANRTHASASFARQLQDKLGDHYVGIYSRDKALNANEENSYFNAALVEKHIPTPADCHYYLCGPETMIRSATRALVSLGITSAHIHTESFEL